MVESRTVPLLLSLIVALLLIVNAGGTDTRTGDRSFVISTTDDRNAYLGLEQTVDTTGNTNNLTVKVTNQFPPGTAVTTITVSVSGDTRTLNDAMQPGQSVSSTFSDISCDAIIRIEATGQNMAGLLERAVAC